jgi:hypothetical protein
MFVGGESPEGLVVNVFVAAIGANLFVVVGIFVEAVLKDRRLDSRLVVNAWGREDVQRSNLSRIFKLISAFEKPFS